MKAIIFLFVITIFPLSAQTLQKKNLESQPSQKQNSIERLSHYVDSRDGQIYKCIKIGDQIWLAQNFNYEIEGSYCYNNNENHESKTGRLYTWEAAQKACPEGWHLPSDKEWQKLEEHLGLSEKESQSIDYRGNSQKLKSKLNALGFNIKMIGCRTYHDGNFLGMNSFTFFWSSTSYKEKYAYKRAFDSKIEGIGRHSHNKKHANSVRYVKD